MLKGFIPMTNCYGPFTVPYVFFHALQRQNINNLYIISNKTAALIFQTFFALKQVISCRPCDLRSNAVIITQHVKLDLQLSLTVTAQMFSGCQHRGHKIHTEAGNPICVNLQLM